MKYLEQHFYLCLIETYDLVDEVCNEIITHSINFDLHHVSNDEISSPQIQGIKLKVFPPYIKCVDFGGDNTLM